MPCLRSTERSQIAGCNSHTNDVAAKFSEVDYETYNKMLFQMIYILCFVFVVYMLCRCGGEISPEKQMFKKTEGQEKLNI